MKQMKRLKSKLMRELRSSAGMEFALDPEDLQEFKSAREHFQQTERSLTRVQDAMVNWAGALDAFSVCTRTLAEELVAHTLLVSHPSDPSRHGTLDSETTKSCRALQSLIAIMEHAAKPVHRVFVETALRPALEGNDVRNISNQLMKVRKAKEACNGTKRKTSHRVNLDFQEPDNNLKTESNSKAEPYAQAQRILADTTRNCSMQMKAFRKTQIAALSQNIGVVLGCNYQFAVRSADCMEQMLLLFPFTACVSVDIASGSCFAAKRIIYQRSIINDEEIIVDKVNRATKDSSKDTKTNATSNKADREPAAKSENSDRSNTEFIPSVTLPKLDDMRWSTREPTGVGFATLNEQFRTSGISFRP